MRYLIQGNEPPERLELLFKLIGRMGENTQEALIDHLCKGHPESLSASMNDLTKPNFSRSLTRLNEVAGIVEEIKEIDWEKFKSSK